MNEEEDASQLRLGPGTWRPSCCAERIGASARTHSPASRLTSSDFKDAQCLLNSEVAVLLQHRMATSAGANDHTASPAFQQTLSYVQRFSRFKNKEALKDVRLYVPSGLLLLDSAS